jgi:hypothetical protein
MRGDCFQSNFCAYSNRSVDISLQTNRKAIPQYLAPYARCLPRREAFDDDFRLLHHGSGPVKHDLAIEMFFLDHPTVAVTLFVPQPKVAIDGAIPVPCHPRAFANSGSFFLMVAIRLDSRCMRSSLVIVQ